ncbi:hypothetical protein MRX96_026771 [Rhipicephalus microplus]
MTQRHSPFALLQILLLAALGQSLLVTSAQLFVPFERDWRTGVCPVFDGPSFGDCLSAVFVAAPSLSAAIRFSAWQQGTASAVPATSWGPHKRAHFDATSGHDDAMTQRHSPFALLQILLLAALGQSPLVTSAQLFVPFERDWLTGVCPVFDGPSFGDGLSAVFVAAPSLSAAIRFPAWQQGTASAVPATSWGPHKRAHFDATSGHDAAMTQRHSPFALLQQSSRVYNVFHKAAGPQGQRVYCDMDTDGGGWTVIQRRGQLGNSVYHFYRNWDEYADGFGNASEEYWIGNKALHALTSDDDTFTLPAVLSNRTGESAFINYESFRVENEENLFKLQLGNIL